jgi:hypothetical protein
MQFRYLGFFCHSYLIFQNLSGVFFLFLFLKVWDSIIFVNRGERPKNLTQVEAGPHPDSSDF